MADSTSSNVWKRNGRPRGVLYAIRRRTRRRRCDACSGRRCRSCGSCGCISQSSVDNVHPPAVVIGYPTGWNNSQDAHARSSSSADNDSTGPHPMAQPGFATRRSRSRANRTPLVVRSSNAERSANSSGGGPGANDGSTARNATSSSTAPATPASTAPEPAAATACSTTTSSRSQPALTPTDRTRPTG